MIRCDQVNVLILHELPTIQVMVHFPDFEKLRLTKKYIDWLLRKDGVGVWECGFHEASLCHQSNLLSMTLFSLSFLSKILFFLFFSFSRAESSPLSVWKRLSHLIVSQSTSVTLVCHIPSFRSPPKIRRNLLLTQNNNRERWRLAMAWSSVSRSPNAHRQVEDFACGSWQTRLPSRLLPQRLGGYFVFIFSNQKPKEEEKEKRKVSKKSKEREGKRRERSMQSCWWWRSGLTLDWT